MLGEKNYLISGLINQRPAVISGALIIISLMVFLFTALFLYSGPAISPPARPLIKMTASYILEGAIASARSWIIIRARTNMRGDFIKGAFGPIDLTEIPEIKSSIMAMADNCDMPFNLDSLTFSYESVNFFKDSRPSARMKENYGSGVFRATITMEGERFTLRNDYDIKVVDTTPPAPQYTLFIRQSVGKEELNSGGHLMLENGSTIPGLIRFNGDEDIFVNLGFFDTNPRSSEKSLVPAPNMPNTRGSFNSGMEEEAALSLLPPLGQSFSHRTSLFGAFLCSSPTTLEGPVYKRWLKWNYVDGQLSLDKSKPFEIAPYNHGGIVNPREIEPEIWRGTGRYYTARAVRRQSKLNIAHGSDGAMKLEGIILCRRLEIEPDIYDLVYSGKSSIIVFDSAEISRNIKRNSGDDILSLVLIPDRRKIRINHATRLDSYLYSGSGIDVGRDEKIQIRGNLAVERLDKTGQLGDITINYDPTARVGIGASGEGNIAVVFSPRIAWLGDNL